MKTALGVLLLLSAACISASSLDGSSSSSSPRLRLDRGSSLKRDADEHHQRGDLALAVEAYRQAMDELAPLGDLPADSRGREQLALTHQCRLSMALCLIKLGDMKSAVAETTQLLTSRPRASVAIRSRSLYQRARALRRCGRPKEATNDLKLAIKMAPMCSSDQATFVKCKSLLATIEQEIEEGTTLQGAPGLAEDEVPAPLNEHDELGDMEDLLDRANSGFPGFGSFPPGGPLGFGAPSTGVLSTGPGAGLASLGALGGLGGLEGLGGLGGMDAAQMANTFLGEGGELGKKLSGLGETVLKKLKEPQTAETLCRVLKATPRPVIQNVLVSLNVPEAERRAERLHGFCASLTPLGVAKFVKITERGVTTVKWIAKFNKWWRKHLYQRVWAIIALWAWGAFP